VSAFRFDCIYYYVRDLDRAIAFYTSVFGLRLASRDAVVRFHIDGVLFELVPTADTQLLTGQGNARLALAVDDIAAALEDLHAKGVRTSPIRTVANGRIASALDPDGNEISLWQHA
jgi:predicted enzyme related to lactoylglutathione lyase